MQLVAVTLAEYATSKCSDFTMKSDLSKTWEPLRHSTALAAFGEYRLATQELGDKHQSLYRQWLLPCYPISSTEKYDTS
jgi:hypothetical protein